MRFITTPRIWKKIKQEHLARTKSLVSISSLPIGKNESVDKINTFHKLFQNVVSQQRPLHRPMYLIDFGRAYSYYLASAVDWDIGELVLEEKYPMWDFPTVVSRDHKYCVATTLLMEEEYKRDEPLALDLYQKIVDGNLPESESGKFLDLARHFYGKPIPKATFFFPLDKEQIDQIEKTIRAAAALIGAVFTEDLKLQNLSPEAAIRNLENIILIDRADFAKSRKKTLYLAAISALYGHLLKLACGYNWGSAWFGDFTGTLTLYGPDKKYFMRPANILRGELKSTSPTCRLLTLCHQIQTNTLPPPEIEGIPEEIL